jgi:arabinofuranosyltransferase
MPVTPTVIVTEREPAVAVSTRVLQAGLYTVPVVGYVAWGWSRRWMSDDGLIYLRVVRQVLAGNGPVFNAGERVEVTAGPVWLGLLTVADVLVPVRLEWIAVGLGIGLSAAGVALAMAGAHRLLASGEDALAVPVGILAVIALPPMWTFASSGLETGCCFAWLGGACLALAHWARGSTRFHPLAAVLLGLGPLIRPDLTLFSAAFLLVVVVAASDWGARARLLACAAVLPLAYEVFRMGYYASLVPNPAIAKEAGVTRWSLGWEYLRDSIAPYWYWFPLAVLLVGAYVPIATALRAARRRRVLAVLLVFPVAAVVYTAYMVMVGGDFMHARLLLPAFFAFAAPVAVLPLRRAVLLLALVPWVMISMVGLRSSADLWVVFGSGDRNPVTTSDFPGWEPGGTFHRLYGKGGVYFMWTKLPVAPVTGADTEVAAYGIGILSYALGPDVYVLDLHGLGDPFTAHMELDPDHVGIPGHEKPLPAPWIAARLAPTDARLAPTDLEPPRFGAPAGEDAPADVATPAELARFEAGVRRARAALRCDRLRALERDYSAPLTFTRFLGNVVDAVSNTRLRIPNDPREAQRRFCRP